MPEFGASRTGHDDDGLLFVMSAWSDCVSLTGMSYLKLNLLVFKVNGLDIIGNHSNHIKKSLQVLLKTSLVLI